MLRNTDYDKNKYVFDKHIFETYIINTSLKFDVNNLIKNIKADYLSEYEELIRHGYHQLVDKVYQNGSDEYYNVRFDMKPMTSGIIVLYITCDGVLAL